MSAMIADRPLHLDSVDFAAAANATAVTGKPIYYGSEFYHYHLGLWHPPLYIYLLAGWFKVFGAGAAQGCAFGMLCALLQGLTVLWIIQTLFGRMLRSSIEPWFWAVFLLNPYTIQTATILDIDSTIYGPLLCLLLLAALRLTWRDGQRRRDEPLRIEYAWIALALTAVLWAKLTTVLLVIPFVGLLLIARFGFWRAARITAFVTAAGLGAFLVTYFAYGALLHLKVGYTFQFLLFSLRPRGSSGQSGLAARLLEFRNNATAMVPFMIRWTGLLPWVACAGGIWISGREALVRRSERAQHYSLLLLLCAGTALYYCSQSLSWGWAPFKYTFVFWGLVLTAPLILAGRNRLWEELPKEQSGEDGFVDGPAFRCLLAALFLVTAWYGRYLLGDRQILEFRMAQWVQFAPAALVLPAIYVGMRGGRWFPHARAALFAGICAWAGLELGVAVYQVKAPYSTTYSYGQTGIEETAAFIRFNTSPSDAIVSMKDLGYLVQRRYYDTIELFSGPDKTQSFIAVLAAGKAKFAVFTETYGQDRLFLNPHFQQWVEVHCVLVASFGDYRVYKVRGA